MNRILTAVNFLGVLAVAGLCIVQWQTNSQLNQDVQTLHNTEVQQSAKIDDQDKAIKQGMSDLDDLRQRLSASDTATKDTQAKLDAMTQQRDQAAAQRDQVTAERDQLKNEQVQMKSALDKWSAAVSERDDVIKQAAQRLQKATDDRNQAVQKYNDLAEKYNAAVKELNGQGK